MLIRVAPLLLSLVVVQRPLPAVIPLARARRAATARAQDTLSRGATALF